MKRPSIRLNSHALWNRLALLGRSQNWLAGQVGITPTYLSYLINHGAAPSGRVRRRMLNALEMEDFHELFTLQHPEQDHERQE